MTTTAAAIANGELVRLANTFDYYLIIYGQPCRIPDQLTAENLFGPNLGAAVRQLSKTELDALPKGPALTAGACKIQGAGDPTQYLYTGGQKHAYDSAFLTRSNMAGTLHGVPAAVARAIPDGLSLIG